MAGDSFRMQSGFLLPQVHCFGKRLDEQLVGSAIQATLTFASGEQAMLAGMPPTGLRVLTAMSHLSAFGTRFQKAFRNGVVMVWIAHADRTRVCTGGSAIICLSDGLRVEFRPTLLVKAAIGHCKRLNDC